MTGLSDFAEIKLRLHNILNQLLALNRKNEQHIRHIQRLIAELEE